jgi:murein DD-endopeptidase MepM/ murein hydrolase activator NlpD
MSRATSAPRDTRPADPSAQQPPPGVFHRIETGQTLHTISKTYDVTVETLTAANDLADPDRIEVGEMLFIPGAGHVLDVPATGSIPRGLFQRPVQARLNSAYGRRRGGMHYGVDLGAPKGAPVRAARAGRVSYAGSGYRGYGKLVIIDHSDGYQTFYAHNSRLIARKGKKVTAGQIIAHVGATGNATAPHLHFEIRKNGRPQNPALYLSF